MGAQVKLARQASEDIREIVAFIARDNSVRAEIFGETLLRKARSLGDHPRIGRVVPKQGDKRIREIVHRSYRIIYKVTDDPLQIFILRFWHAARGHPQIVED